MSRDFQQINKGINLPPQAADPVSPSEGAFYFSDGTIREIGLWQYKSGAWVIVGKAGGVTSGSISSTKTADYTVLSSDNGKTINIDTTSGPISITMPAPAIDFIVTIKDLMGTSATNKITVSFGSNEIDGTFGLDVISTNYNSVSYTSTANTWTRIANFAGDSTSVRGLFGGGDAPSSAIEYISIATTGNAISFGNLTRTAYGVASMGNRTRGLWAGSSASNIIDYVTFSTLGNAIDFGDLTIARSEPSATANNTRGLIAAGTSGGRVNVIDYVTIATLGNAIDFGDLTGVRMGIAACASTTRAIFAGGNTPTVLNVIDYVTIATIGNATSFGTLANSREYSAACSSSTRAMIGGGDNGPVVLAAEYLTIATLGNGTTFGNLTLGRWNLASCSSQVRGVWAGGFSISVSPYNTIDYVTIATTGAATSFGTLTVAKAGVAGCSNGHGGLS
mgnify:CR=1 FL=1